MKKLSWFHKNKVLLIGLVMSVALPLSDLLNKGVTSTKVLVVAGLAAITSVLARNLRGQIGTLAGVIGTLLATYFTDSNNHPISWAQITLQAIILYFGASSAPPKSIGYERTAEIVEAKKQGELLVPTLAPPKP